jgi:hypothetical protein
LFSDLQWVVDAYALVLAASRSSARSPGSRSCAAMTSWPQVRSRATTEE